MAKLEDRAARAKQELTSAWDSTREERALFNVMAAHKRALSSAAGATTGRHRLWRWFGGVGVAVATVALILVASRIGEQNKRGVAQILVAPTGESHLPVRTAVWQALPIGVARLYVEADDGRRVRLRQPAGKVEYDVKPSPERNFSVRAGDVEIRVRGTRFTVESTDSWVEVRVSRGSVEVFESTRNTLLRGGEFLRVPTWRGADPVIPGASDPRFIAPSPAPTSASVRVRPHPAKPTADIVEPALLKADQARKSGDLSTAAKILRGMAARVGNDPRGATIWFTLGRVEAQRGHYDASARAFDHGWRAHPDDPLAADALAESAQSLRAAGRIDAARAAARRYLDRFAHGGQIHRMRAIIDP